MLGLRQGLSELKHFLLKTFDYLVILLDIVLDVLQPFFEHFDQFQAFAGNLVLVVLHFLVAPGMVLHQLIPVLVLTLLNLVDFHLHAEFELLLELLHLDLVAIDEVLFLSLQLSTKGVNLLLEALFVLVGLRDIVDVLADILFLLLVLVHPVLLLLLGVEGLLILHFSLSLDLLFLTVVEVVVVEMLDLLHIGGDLSTVFNLHLLHFSIQVRNESLLLSDFLPGV